VDSLLIVDLIPQNARVLDVGSGPGFPAWPLACMRPDIHVTALDSSSKVIEFLKSVSLPNLTPIQVRAEDFDQREKFHLVTGRAVAPLSIQLEISAPYCMREGTVIPFRTPSEEEEIQRFPAHKLGLKLTEVLHRVLPTTEIVRVFPIFKKVETTSLIYPRIWSQMKRNPL
jgi:16S rRNA (guanine527-N7)-methyltransferase